MLDFMGISPVSDPVMITSRVILANRRSKVTSFLKNCIKKALIRTRGWRHPVDRIWSAEMENEINERKWKRGEEAVLRDAVILLDQNLENEMRENLLGSKESELVPWTPMGPD
ncbi:uncharacterized protein LOC105700989 [Orussus abietinus]|uniref:uncharacterized protein LOC105700989 n=1 Tax=Orussus abietinus TaxID=222816 RepID=UPI0006263DCB|nr:uncharacterized protein LOC105700989 [Orussus abietinus]